MARKEITKSEVRKIALKYLAGNKLMTLATIKGGKPWVATVFFAYDDKFNFYFFSRPDTEHCKQIKKNPNVAVAVNQDWGSPGAVKGFMLQGRAGQVAKGEYTRFYTLYKKRYPWAAKYDDHVLYRIRPDVAFHLNQKAFGHFFRVSVL